MHPLTPALSPVAGERAGVRGLPRRGLFFRAKSRKKLRRLAGLGSQKFLQFPIF